MIATKIVPLTSGSTPKCFSLKVGVHRDSVKNSHSDTRPKNGNCPPNGTTVSINNTNRIASVTRIDTDEQPNNAHSMAVSRNRASENWRRRTGAEEGCSGVVGEFTGGDTVGVRGEENWVLLLLRGRSAYFAGGNAAFKTSTAALSCASLI